MDLRGFVTPANEYEGLQTATNRLNQQKATEAANEQQRKTQANASGKFLADYLDPKEHLTGTAYDPQIIKGFGDLLQEGISLANQGADNNTIMMAIGQKVNKLNQYSQKAKIINDRIKQQVQLVKPMSGYDAAKLENEAKKTAFYTPDGQLKDINDVDPEKDWMTETVSLYPERVTTNEGIDDFVKSSAPFVTKDKLTTYNKMGGKSISNKVIKQHEWQQLDKDESGAITGLVPKYKIATDEGVPIKHDFTDENGKITKADVRMVDDNTYRNILSNKPSVADWLRGQVKQHISEYGDGKISMDSPQVEMVAKAILYDELKRRGGGSISDDEVPYQPSGPQIRNYFTGSPYTSGGKGGSGGGDVEVNDVMKRIKDKVGSVQNGFPVNELDSDEQSAVISVARNLSGDNDLGNGDFYLKKGDDGKVGVYLTTGYAKQAKRPPFLGNLSTVGVNLKAQPGVKEKRAVIKDGQQQAAPAPAPEKSDWKSRAKKV